MNIRISALVAAVFILLAPAVALADNPIVIGNVEPTTVSFAIRCVAGADNGWHQFSLRAGEYKWFNSDLWGDQSLCPGVFEMSIPTEHADGTVTRQLIRMTNDTLAYEIVKTQSVGYYAHEARSMIVVSNDSNRPASLNYMCAGQQWAKMNLAPGARSWVFVGARPCSPYVGSIIERSGEPATLPTSPLPPGYVYSLRWNDGAQRWNLTHVKPEDKAPN